MVAAGVACFCVFFVLEPAADVGFADENRTLFFGVLAEISTVSVTGAAEAISMMGVLAFGLELELELGACEETTGVLTFLRMDFRIFGVLIVETDTFGVFDAVVGLRVAGSFAFAFGFAIFGAFGVVVGLRIFDVLAATGGVRPWILLGTDLTDIGVLTIHLRTCAEGVFCAPGVFGMYLRAE